jgi:hypothetical protein
VRRLGLLASATVVYLLAAWMVRPGFYDGFTPVQPYNWVCPPFHIANNLAPSSGELDIKVIDGVSDANSAFTDDGQVVVGFLPGAFDVTGKTTISVDIAPVKPCPSHPGLTFATNVYHFSADAPLVKAATVVMRFSDLVPAPSFIYFATSPDGPWKTIGGRDGQPFTFVASTREFGYFAAGYPEGAVSSRSRTSASQLLPIAVAILIVGVLVAGIPLAVIRRRRAGGPEPESDEEDEEEPT